jgi:hypothetical protein
VLTILQLDESFEPFEKDGPFPERPELMRFKNPQISQENSKRNDTLVWSLNLTPAKRLRRLKPVTTLLFDRNRQEKNTKLLAIRSRH